MAKNLILSRQKSKKWIRVPGAENKKLRFKAKVKNKKTWIRVVAWFLIIWHFSKISTTTKIIKHHNNNILINN